MFSYYNVIGDENSSYRDIVKFDKRFPILYIY